MQIAKKISRHAQGGHAQVKVKFPAFTILSQSFLAQKITHFNLQIAPSTPYSHPFLPFTT